MSRPCAGLAACSNKSSQLNGAAFARLGELFGLAAIRNNKSSWLTVGPFLWLIRPCGGAEPLFEILRRFALSPASDFRIILHLEVTSHPISGQIAAYLGHHSGYPQRIESVMLIWGEQQALAPLICNSNGSFDLSFSWREIL
jgi:hypothetical protein